MKIKIYTLFFCLLLLSQSQAQLPCKDLTLPKERITLQLDRNICLAGEAIWFKAWCFLDGKLDVEMSKVLYVEIFDETQKSIVQEKFLLDNNKAIGSIQIPEDAASKYYFLRAYTRYMRNFSSAEFHYQQVTIVNPLIENESIEVQETKLTKLFAKAKKQEDTYIPPNRLVKVELEKDSYQPRQKINFQVSTSAAINADFSAVVRMQGLGNQPNQQVTLNNGWLIPDCMEDPSCKLAYDLDSTPVLSLDEQEENSSHLQWLPETRGLTISGLIQNKEKKPIENALSIVSILQEEPMLYMGMTDTKGAFTICLHDMKDQKNLFVGTPNDKNTVLIRNDFDSNFPEITTVPLRFDSTTHALLKALNLHQQLKQTYPKNKTQFVFQNKAFEIPFSNILGPDRRVLLADFIEMSTMSEVFEEITSGVLVRKKDGKPSLSVFNSKQQKTYDSPLVLLDNVPVYNISELLKIAPSKIEAIEIYNTNYFLGNFTLGAIISIISKTDDFAAYNWSDQGAFAKFKTYSVTQPFEEVLHSDNSHFPDFRPVLYWQPSLEFTQKERKQSISIYAPDRPGIYEILIQGFTNSGDLCYAYAAFEVVK